ncbi:hypothetical protein TWF730_004548 [Orbilia blumenaviensis]|uniref:DUF4246 domain-containing protein n=1 Tax=Orbilia blumenaviensis TaxID=1796055 RepID=A0AAV9U209_9PEZI
MLRQHVQPLSLVDRSKPGFQKVLIFYLCEPSMAHNMPSTDTVLPQQPEARPAFIDELRDTPLGSLPEEVFQMIIGFLPPPISREEAGEYRDDLLEERRLLSRNIQRENS